MRTVVVVNGEISDPAPARALAEAADLLVCADGGTRHVRAWGLRPHLVVGDFDSTDAGYLDALAAAGTQLFRYPAHKDETDLELALEHALRAGSSDIVVLGAVGGRIDHALANILLLTWERLAGVKVAIVDGSDRLFLGRSPVVIHGHAGDIVSLLPLSPVVEDVRSTGLEYPLVGESLSLGPTRGISNVMLEDVARVTFGAGRLIVVHHDAFGEPAAP